MKVFDFRLLFIYLNKPLKNLPIVSTALVTVHETVPPTLLAKLVIAFTTVEAMLFKLCPAFAKKEPIVLKTNT